MSALLLVPLAAALAGSAFGEPGAQRQRQAGPESRALAYLAHEVPRWSRENKCYSCHNNGDAARALYTAVRLSFPVPPKALEETSRWLARPQRWDHNGGASPFSDKKLARIQFAAALVEALGAGQAKDRQALIRAAELVAEHQEKDGFWQVDALGTIGSPATYGACLATCQARHVLQTADSARYQTAIAKADQWLGKVAVKSVLDAAAVLLALEASQDSAVPAQRRQCLLLINKGQAANGGWGPYVNTPPEPFDTAVVLLALCRYVAPENALVPKLQLGNEGMQVKPMIQRGRAYLVSAQQRDGSWTETTRPAGMESYAQRISTTGWATLALLASH